MTLLYLYVCADSNIDKKQIQKNLKKIARQNWKKKKTDLSPPQQLKRSACYGPSVGKSPYPLLQGRHPFPPPQQLKRSASYGPCVDTSLRSVQCTQNNLQWTMLTLRFTVYSVQ